MVVKIDNQEKVDIEIMNEKADEPINDISSVVFSESDDEEEKEENFIEFVIVQKSIGRK